MTIYNFKPEVGGAEALAGLALGVGVQQLGPEPEPVLVVPDRRPVLPQPKVDQPQAAPGAAAAAFKKLRDHYKGRYFGGLG